MFIRLYVNANNESEARRILNVFLEKFQSILGRTKLEKIEPYWKFDHAFVIEIYLTLLEDTQENEIIEVLESIADKWIEFGEPINELLASDTDEECTFILPGINMINIHFN